MYCMSHKDTTYIYSSNGGDTWTTSDPYSAQASWNVTGLVLEGHILYASLSDGTDSIVRQIDTDNIAGGWSNYTNAVSSRYIRGIFNVKNYILSIENDGKLQELDGTSAPTLIKDLPSGSLWTSIIDGGSVILAAADDGYIYAIKDDQTSGLY